MSAIHLPQIVEPFEPFWAYGISDTEYHSDRSAVGSGRLKRILKSPKNFLQAFLDSPTQEPTAAMKFGSLVHLAVLEATKFSKLKVAPDFGDMRSSTNRKTKQEWITAQGIAEDDLVDSEDHVAAIAIQEAIRGHKDACALLRYGQAEIPGFFRDPETGIKCRIKPDYFIPDKNILVDLKTTVDCTASEFSKSIWNMRYDLQMAFYREGIYYITGKLPDCVFIAVEKTKPYEVSVFHADESLLAKGNEDYHQALGMLKDCLEKNEWPGVQQSMETISLPSWVK